MPPLYIIMLTLNISFTVEARRKPQAGTNDCSINLRRK